MKRLAVALLILTSGVGAAQIKTPKEQCEQLLSDVIPLVEKLLLEHGEFYPLGVSLKKDGTQALVAADNGADMPKSQPLLDLLRDGLSQAARKGDIVASAVAYDVQITPPNAGVKTDAIAVELEHRDNYSVLVFFPYRLEGGAIVFGEALAESGTRYVFVDGA